MPIATQRLASIVLSWLAVPIAGELETIEGMNEFLTLEGLRTIYERNQKKKKRKKK